MFQENIYGADEQWQTVGSRIKHIRKSQKMTQQKFAESLGIVQGFLSAIEKGKKAPSDTLLIALQYIYRVNREWIYSGQGEITQGNSEASQTGYVAAIPLLNELPASKEEFQQATLNAKHISLPDAPTGSFAFKYRGDYMFPTVRDGDIIIIEPDKTLASGNIGLIVGKWREPFLRRYREINGESYFSTDNLSYATFQPDTTTVILGVVVKVWREIKI